jgi:succinyl-CoA synthetase alpha subunit
MQLSARIAELPGLSQACAIMASENNLALLRSAGFLKDAIEAGPNDLLISLLGSNSAALEAAMIEAEAALHAKPLLEQGGGPRREPPRSIEMGLETMPGADIALISTPGAYAAAEAMKALRLGLNVMVFSDNVALEEEIALKIFARDNDLLVMGPDCGTAILNGIPIGFANVVRRGEIGVVAASGTGLQQVTCLIDRYGKGISQGIGTGGHDLHERVGGISMLQALSALAADPATRVIVLISKPPSREVAERVIEAASRVGKPVVINFLGADLINVAFPNLYAAKTLEDAANAAVALAERRQPRIDTSDISPEVKSGNLSPKRCFIRALYSGGTFCYEATALLGEALTSVYSNTPVGTAISLDDVWKSRAHTLVDLGDDVFTRGRPHPMIDHRLRNERILAEAEDPSVAVILFDIVLGYGSHPDPAAEIVPVLKEAQARATRINGPLVFVGFVCGTESDPQNLARQERLLTEAGVILAASNAQAVRLAGGIAAGAEKR